jgi:hypothetical protein
MIHKKYSQFIVLILLSFVFSSCQNRQDIDTYGYNQNKFEDTLEKLSIGSQIHEQIYEGKKFALSFHILPEEYPNANDSVDISVNYTGLTPEFDNHKANLEFTLDKGEKINLVRPPLTDDQKRIWNENREALKPIFSETIGFVMSKKDFRKLKDSRKILFKFSANSIAIKGELSQNEIDELKKSSDKFLNKKPYKSIATEEPKIEEDNNKDIFGDEGGFEDFYVLSYHANKQDIAKHYKVKLNSTTKNTKTNHIEEIVYPKIDGQVTGPIVLGFNDVDQLVYVRDFFNENKINWLKERAR